jgi:16S rRNA (cytidine1402-2'-O)-methyltransferase
VNSSTRRKSRTSTEQLNQNETEKDSDQDSSTGVLYVVSTPIGNLEDITLRALRILKEVKIVAAEDTRHTQKLLTHYQIHTTLTSYHDFNKEHKTPLLLQRLREGQDIALVSDAGTPVISDPGYFLITRCVLSGIAVVPLPGASAVLASLAVSGLPSDAFRFEGFLPRRRAARLKRLEALKTEGHTLIIFESPHRIGKTLADIKVVMGARRAVLARELTKKFEEIIRGTIDDLIRCAETRNLKGEMTLLVAGEDS